MTINIGGVGIPLPVPQVLYPNIPASSNAAGVNGIAYEAATNYGSLAPGESLIVPPGQWLVGRSGSIMAQYLDTVTGIWRGYSSVRAQNTRFQSDGANFRLFNPTGCPVSAIVTAQGSGYSQSSTTVTANGSGGSTWMPIIGGALNTSVTVATGGSGYTIAPTVYFPAPPYPGIPATGYATLSAGAVSAVTLVDVGAGYLTAPTPVVIPSPYDPNLANIVSATLTTSISNNTGKLCGVLCTNPGGAVTTVPTLTVTGAGSSATCTAVALCTITASSASGGANYTTSNKVITSGGQSNASEVSAAVNPSVSLSTFIPRSADGIATISTGALSGFTFYDTGLFASSNFSSNQPNPIVINNTGSSAPSGALTLSLTLGGAAGGFSLQPV